MVAVGFSLWTSWQREHAKVPAGKSSIVVQHEGGVPVVTKKSKAGRALPDVFLGTAWSARLREYGIPVLSKLLYRKVN